MSAFIHWTTKERATLVRMREAGKSLQEIADALPGRSRKGVSNFIKRHGLPQRFRATPAPKPLPEPAEVVATKALGEAVNRYFARVAYAAGISSAEAGAMILGDCQRASRRIHIGQIDRTGHTPFEVVSGRFPPKTQAEIVAVFHRSAEA